MKNTVSVLILIFSCISAFGQRGFYTTDSTIFSGVKIIDNGKILNARWCEVNKKEKTERYSPDEVEIYGFNKGRIYVSKNIPYSGSSNNFFLEELSKGKLTLYYFADKKGATYFIEKESRLQELAKGNRSDDSYFQMQLQKISSDFPGIYNNAYHVHYNRRALSRFITDYNNRLYKPFPYFKIGFVGMAEMSKLVKPAKSSFGVIDQINYLNNSSAGGGVFTDIPIYASNFSYHMELLYTKHSYSFSTESADEIIDVAANISSVKVPVLVRYTYPSKKISPFFNAGAIFIYNTNKKAKFLDTKYSGNIIEIEDITDMSIIANSQAGLSAGLGLEYRLNYKHSLFFELRYNRLFGDNKTFNGQDIQFLASFNF